MARGKEATITERTQALTLHSTGAGYAKIEEVTGIKKGAFAHLLRKAKERGYVKGGRVDLCHVESAKRSGRPRIITEENSIGQIIEAVVTKNSTTRQYSTQEIAEAIAERLKPVPGAIAPSRRTILRWLHANGFKNVKLTTKPGLNNPQKLRRLEWCLQHQDWTLDDWKRVVWSDETSVVLGAIRGKRRVWRRTRESEDGTCISRRWKGFKSFMFWASFTYDAKGPCYVWPNQNAKMKAKYKAMMDKYNAEHEAEDREKWELETAMRRMGIARNKGGPKPKWVYNEKTGKQVRKGKGGIDWIRYREEILKPRYIPFMKRLKKDHGDYHLVQEDNAAAHISPWNRGLWKAHGFTVIDWVPNSPDLSAIEPPWARMKQSYKKRLVPKAEEKMKLDWKKQWGDMPLDKLQRYVERIAGHIKWVIRLAGGNEYKEGTEPPPLPPGEEEPGLIKWREWLAKTHPEREAELREHLKIDDPNDDWQDDEVDFGEFSSLLEPDDY